MNPLLTRIEKMIKLLPRLEIFDKIIKLKYSFQYYAYAIRVQPGTGQADFNFGMKEKSIFR